jgi:hypothetical protein
METFLGILTVLAIIIAMPFSMLSIMFGDNEGYTILEEDAHFYE